MDPNGRLPIRQEYYSYLSLSLLLSGLFTKVVLRFPERDRWVCTVARTYVFVSSFENFEEKVENGFCLKILRKK